LRGEFALQLPHQHVFFTTPELLEIGNIPMTSLNEKPNRTEALKYYRRVADHFKLNIRQYERVDRIAGHDGAFQVTPPTAWVASYLYARKDRPGHRATTTYRTYAQRSRRGLSKVLHYYKEPHPYYNHDVAVIGAKNSAAIARWSFWTGARVTLIHRGAGDLRKSEVLDQTRISKTASSAARSRRTLIHITLPGNPARSRNARH
jgi:thioredoxin reductase (NADPH)